MPENFLNYLDQLITDSRASLAYAFDEVMDDRLAFVRSTRLQALLEVKTEAADYEMV